MAFAPQYVNGTYNPLVVTWTKDGSSPQVLTGMTIELWFQSVMTPGKKFKGTGSITPVDLANGKFNYTFSQADLAVADVYLVQFKAYIVSTNPVYSDIYEIPVLQGPAP